MNRTSLTFRRAALAIPAGLAMALAAPAFAAPGGGHGMGCGPIPRLSVTGQGESRIAPDLAVIQLGVSTQADSAAAAMEQNAGQQTAVIEALNDSGIESDEIQTSGINLNPLVDYDDGRAPRVTGYQASNMVSVRVTELDRLGEVLDAIVAAGANEISGIHFQREDGLAAEDDARRDAVEDARHKAGIMAEAAGLELGPVLVIRDTPQNGVPQPMMMRAEAASAARTPVEPGQLSVTAQVQVDYALKGDGFDCGAHRGRGKLPEGHPPVPQDGAAQDDAAHDHAAPEDAAPADEGQPAN